MIVAFSTSSPVASVAFIGLDGGILFGAQMQAPAKASGALLEMLQNGLAETGTKLSDATGFASDIGPGSFIGVRVGIMLAKVFAELHEKPCAGATSFDLINATQVVAIPNRKSDFLLRVPGRKPELITEVPPLAVGYRLGGGDDQFPNAAGFSPLLDRLVWQSAVEFVPEYEVPPSISQPKQAFAVRGPS